PDSTTPTAPGGSAQQKRTGSAAGPGGGTKSRSGGSPSPGSALVPAGLYVRVNSHGLVASRYDGSDQRVLAPAGRFALSPDHSHVLWSSCADGCPLKNVDV